MSPVAFVVCSEVLGGHEFQVLHLAKLVSTFRQVTVLLSARFLEPLFQEAGCPVVVHEGLFFSPGRIGTQVARGVVRRQRIRSVLSSYGEIVVCAGAVEASMTVGVALARRPGLSLYLPSLNDRRLSWGWWGAPYTAGLRALLNVFPRLITINKIQAKIVAPGYFGQIAVIGNYVPPLDRLPDRGIPPRLVFVGRLDAQKRVIELIDYVDFADNPFKELLVIGDGPLAQQVRDAARSACHVKISVLGRLDIHAQELLLSCRDVLVLNSVVEGEPMVLREAQKRGMKSVVRDIAGVRGISSRDLRFSGKAHMREILLRLANCNEKDWPRKIPMLREVDRLVQARRVIGSPDSA